MQRRELWGFFGKKYPSLLVTGSERGRRRTRQDQISRKAFRHSRRQTGEIANHLRSAPNEENSFLLPDRLLSGANSVE
jgi:hypothetical protein